MALPTREFCLKMAEFVYNTHDSKYNEQFTDKDIELFMNKTIKLSYSSDNLTAELEPISSSIKQNIGIYKFLGESYGLQAKNPQQTIGYYVTCVINLKITKDKNENTEEVLWSDKCGIMSFIIPKTFSRKDTFKGLSPEIKYLLNLGPLGSNHFVVNGIRYLITPEESIIGNAYLIIHFTH
jgi:hypothetical protein